MVSGILHHNNISCRGNAFQNTATAPGIEQAIANRSGGKMPWATEKMSTFLNGKTDNFARTSKSTNYLYLLELDLKLDIPTYLKIIFEAVSMIFPPYCFSIVYSWGLIPYDSKQLSEYSVKFQFSGGNMSVIPLAHDGIILVRYKTAHKNMQAESDDLTRLRCVQCGMNVPEYSKLLLLVRKDF